MMSLVVSGVLTGRVGSGCGGHRVKKTTVLGEDKAQNGSPTCFMGGACVPGAENAIRPHNRCTELGPGRGLLRGLLRTRKVEGWPRSVYSKPPRGDRGQEEALFREKHWAPLPLGGASTSSLLQLCEGKVSTPSLSSPGLGSYFYLTFIC